MAKHRTLRRALSILLALCFVMSIFTVNVFADEGEKPGEAKSEISEKAEAISKEIKEVKIEKEKEAEKPTDAENPPEDGSGDGEGEADVHAG